MPDRPDFLDELRWRGLLFQCTDEAGLCAHLSSADAKTGGRRAYIGFDPTADSLTIGNLVPIMVLVHSQRAGHTPVVVMGGGTGMIGDPSGKSAERMLLNEDRVRANVEAQRPIFERFLDFGSAKPNRAQLVNNNDWLGKLGYIEVLRDVGKHFSVNEMIKRESVRARLEEREHGISYTEFSYAILQSYDYLHLHQKHGVTLQMGGSDQWGNIVAGADLIRRVAGHEAPAFGLTAPLVNKADGGKFGKTESGAVWLTAERTSPYAYYQFWLNAADADVPKYLRIFTLLPREEIEALERAHAADPAKRDAQKALARHATTLLHGESEAAAAESKAGALFSGGSDADFDQAARELLSRPPDKVLSKSELESGPRQMVDVLVLTGVAPSKREARTLLAAGAIAVNGKQVGPESTVSAGDLIEGRMLAIRRGKKTWHCSIWE